MILEEQDTATEIFLSRQVKERHLNIERALKTVYGYIVTVHNMVLDEIALLIILNALILKYPIVLVYPLLF